ncbi:hypothetical protein [Heliophilum fasciatum]|uniref:Uncharacterized protein n=1 Tax=Heliophilum fasciatum TaxID=35700 RepID=A0A4R2RRM8_9FIRM|nr:hypothetical protein [Heliophilum fasciatum]MCW2278730.1 hypothetical protein [Heliophilum fasciatum]TCP62531.1 hypothetical protein EDD73_12129 [Heliophilum fasciatum]
MFTIRPKFFDSPWFVMEPGNWHLLPGAPEDVVKEFEEYQAAAAETLNSPEE